MYLLVEGTDLSGAAAFLRHTASKAEEKRKRLHCGKRGFIQEHTVQTHYWHSDGTD